MTKNADGIIPLDAATHFLILTINAYRRGNVCQRVKQAISIQVSHFIGYLS